MKRFILSAILGAIILYAWGFVAYMALPIYSKIAKTFTNETLVSETLAQTTSGAGVYFLPDCFGDKKVDDPGPMVMMTYVPSAKPFLGAGPYIYSFLIQLAVAALLSILAGISHIKCYFGRLFHLTLIGFTGSFAMFISAMNWIGMDWRYALAQMAFYTIGFFLAGLVIAACMKPKEHHPEEQHHEGQGY